MHFKRLFFAVKDIFGYPEYSLLFKFNYQTLKEAFDAQLIFVRIGFNAIFISLI